MSRLTQKDDQGNWCLKGVRWEQLHTGSVITWEVREKLYAALWKLMEYEDSGLSPEEVQDMAEQLHDTEKPEKGPDAAADGRSHHAAFYGLQVARKEAL